MISLSCEAKRPEQIIKSNEGSEMNTIEIYKVENKEILERCLRIRNSVFIIEKGVPEEIEIDEYDSMNEMCAHFLVRYQNTDAGTVRCLNVSDDTLKIQRFCILREYRNSGLGRAILEYVESQYKKQGFNTIKMDAKYEVFGFYEKCGYRKVSDVFMEANVQHVKMMKKI